MGGKHLTGGDAEIVGGSPPGEQHARRGSGGGGRHPAEPEGETGRGIGGRRRAAGDCAGSGSGGRHPAEAEAETGRGIGGEQHANSGSGIGGRHHAEGGGDVEDGDDAVYVNLPCWEERKTLISQDPLAVIEAFQVWVRVVLSRLLGVRMCPNCPHCNADGSASPCQDRFGSNMRPLGGIFGAIEALAGALEHQRLGTPHLHFNAYLVSIYQHCSLEEIGRRIQEELLKAKDIFDFQSWVSTEEPPAPAKHREEMAAHEAAWPEYKGREHDDMSQLPSYITQDRGTTMWDHAGGLQVSAAQKDGDTFREAYDLDAQGIFSRRQHHWHARDASGQRVPLTACRKKHTKKGVQLCRHSFPKIKQVSRRVKLVCPGVAKLHDLRITGRRNALGSLLGKRSDAWQNGTARAFAVFFRSNTDTSPNMRLPIMAQTHDPACNRKCCEVYGSLQRICRLAQRAQRQTSGYFSGYIVKRQPVGSYETQLAADSMAYLKEKLNKKTQAGQHAAIVNRVLVELEGRGTMRTAAEEFNLTVNLHSQDVTNPEFLRTFMTQTFFGKAFVELQQQARRDAARKRARATTVKMQLPARRGAVNMTVRAENAPWPLLYGYRPLTPALRLLSPWEFTQYYQPVMLYPPCSRASKDITTWCEGGEDFYKEHRAEFAAEDDPMFLLAGVHYCLREEAELTPEIAEGLLFYPEDPTELELQKLRARWALRRRFRPAVPRPDTAPLPGAGMDRERRAMLFSVYLRCWVLRRADACFPALPHLADLNLVVQRPPRQRLLHKQVVAREQRDFDKAWRGYIRGHIVSHHAKQTIFNFMSATGDVNSKKDDSDEEEQKAPVAPSSLPMVHMSLQRVHALIRAAMHQEAADEAANDGERKPSVNVEMAVEATWKLYGGPSGSTGVAAALLPEKQNLPIYEEYVPLPKETAEDRAAKRRKKKCVLPGAGIYQKYDADRVQEWFAAVQAEEEPPNEEQLGVLRAVAVRSAREAAEERQDQVRSTSTSGGLCHPSLEASRDHPHQVWRGCLVTPKVPESTRLPGGRGGITPRDHPTTDTMLDQVVAANEHLSGPGSGGRHPTAEDVRAAADRTEPMRAMVHGLPGAGKSRLIKWLRSFFEDALGWSHEIEFVCLASQNTMAALIHGCTLHSWAEIPVSKQQKQRKKQVAWTKPDLNPMFDKTKFLRWILVDEGSTAGAELFAAMDDTLRKCISREGTYGRRRDGSKRRFGGVNFLEFVDWWQLPPVKLTACFASPLLQHSSQVDQMLSMFWTKDRDAFNHFTELHQEMRCKDKWLREVLKECREGCQQWEMYYFLHGLPTENTGSWLPSLGGPSCKNPACEKLAAEVWPTLRRGGSTWTQRQEMECHTCKLERSTRCRVLQSDDDPRQLEEKFVSAPYVHPYNASKSLAQKLRAQHWASVHKRKLLWAVAYDVALTTEDKAQSTEAKEHQKEGWLKLHDRQTAGIMGLCPLALDMPVRFMETVSKDRQIYKHGRGVIAGWTLGALDAERVRTEDKSELVLTRMPSYVFVKIPEATWVHEAGLDPGVYPMRPVRRVWTRDAAGQAKVRRVGFPLVPDFAGTVHSYTGCNLDAVMADCLSWQRKPRREDQQRSYINLSRVQTRQETPGCSAAVSCRVLTSCASSGGVISTKRPSVKPGRTRSSRRSSGKARYF